MGMGVVIQAATSASTASAKSRSGPRLGGCFCVRASLVAGNGPAIGRVVDSVHGVGVLLDHFGRLVVLRFNNKGTPPQIKPPSMNNFRL